MIATDTYYICLSAGGILFGGLELRKPGVQQSAMVLQGQINEAGCRCAEIGNTIYWALNADHFIFLGFCCGSCCMMKLWALYLTHYACKCWALYAVHIFVLDFCPRRVYWILYIDHFFVFLFFLISLGFIYRPYYACWLDSLGYMCGPLPYFCDIDAFLNVKQRQLI